MGAGSVSGGAGGSVVVVVVVVVVVGGGAGSSSSGPGATAATRVGALEFHADAPNIRPVHAHTSATKRSRGK